MRIGASEQLAKRSGSCAGAAWRLNVARVMSINGRTLFIQAAPIPATVLMQKILQTLQRKFSRVPGSPQVGTPKYYVAHVNGHFFAYDMQHFCKAHITARQEALQSWITSGKGEYFFDGAAVIASERLSCRLCHPAGSISLVIGQKFWKVVKFRAWNPGALGFRRGRIYV